MTDDSRRETHSIPDSERSRNGCTHLYYGPGKGKTTAAMGLVVRAVGHGQSVAVLQFMKGHDEIGTEYGEFEFLREHDSIDVWQFPTRHVESADDLDERERDILLDGLETARRVVTEAEFDIVVLDELTLLTTFGFVAPAELLDLFETRPQSVELVVTGRKAPEAFVEAAEYVTYMEEIKHPYRRGVTARPGIEF